MSILTRITILPPCLAVFSSFFQANCAAEGPTYHKDILPIFQESCVGCHRPGELAPMDLGTYAAMRPWVKSIREAVMDRTMPPWFADASHKGTFSNENTLDDAQIAMIERWIAAGAPEGDPADAPPAPEFTEGWTIGEPDAVFTMSEEFTLVAEGPDEYNYFTIPTLFEEDRWLTAVEVRPGAPEIVHHVIVFVEEPGAKGRKRFSPEGGTEGKNGPVESNSFEPTEEELARILERQERVARIAAGRRPAPRDPVEMGMLGGMAPGMPAWIARPGEGRLLKAGSKLLLQIHYHPSGRELADRTSVGVKFADGPVSRRRHTTGVFNMGFAIPPHADNHMVEAKFTLARPIHVESYMPHLHLRGKAFEYRALLPDGTERLLLSVPKYDFNWQLVYELVEPVALPAGTTLVCRAWYDNSAGNPANPAPENLVRFGEPTIDEMMIGWFDYTFADEVANTEVGS